MPKRAGLVKAGGAWLSWPEQMCQWRAVGFCADIVFPDTTGGMTTLMKAPEQFGVGLTEAGDVIDGQYSTVPTTPARDPAADALDDLLEKHTAEEILAVNEGKIPGTEEEIAAVLAKLEA